jgi:hypothetical protein
MPVPRTSGKSQLVQPACGLDFFDLDAARHGTAHHQQFVGAAEEQTHEPAKAWVSLSILLAHGPWFCETGSNEITASSTLLSRNRATSATTGNSIFFSKDSYFFSKK